MDDPVSDREMAAEVWRRLFQVFMGTRWQRDEVLPRLGLTPNDSKALHTLDPVEGKPMRALAEAWGTDASAATWVVDRLERKGLVERRECPEDRRARYAALTPQGETLIAEIFPEHALALEHALAGLDDADKETAARLLRTLGRHAADTRPLAPDEG